MVLHRQTAVEVTELIYHKFGHPTKYIEVWTIATITTCVSALAASRSAVGPQGRDLRTASAVKVFKKESSKYCKVAL
jgi:hypothetical protein